MSAEMPVTAMPTLALGSVPAGSIEFLGLWRDTGDRAMPIKMKKSCEPHQIRRAFDVLVNEMRQSGVRSGIFAAQNFNQVQRFWS